MMIQRIPTKLPDPLPDPFLILVGVLGLIVISAIATRRVIFAWIATFALICAVAVEAIAMHQDRPPAARIGNEQAGVAMHEFARAGAR